MADYIASLQVEQEWIGCDAAVFNGAPWGVTMRQLAPQLAVVDCPANDNEASRAEFAKCNMPYRYQHQYEPELWKLYSQFMVDANVVIVQAKQSINYLNCNCRCIDVVPGGCHLPTEVKPVPTDKFRVGYIGAYGPDKGVRYLIRAWAGLMLPDAECVFAGTDSVRLTNVLQLYNRANWQLWGYADDIDEFYDSISVYIQPSVTEGFGLPVLEAMAHERPVIVTRGAGVWELVSDCQEGLVIDAGSAEQLADAIRWFADKPERIAEMGQAARKKAEQYTWARAQAEYERILRGGA